MSSKKLSGEAELEKLQEQSFSYFLHEANLTNGLVMDKNAPGWPASIAATGLALAAYPVAVERGLMTYSWALERTLMVLRFFWTSRQGPEPDATGYKGLYYHFLDMHTGRRAWQCELSTVDSAFLLAGALTAAIYFSAATPDETEVRTLADALYQRADWEWALNDGQTLTHGWKPESGFIRYRWEGYDEALLLYILALGSPEHAIPESSYPVWLSTYRWESCYGYEYVYAGPLFTHQLSHCWVDFRGIQDAYMREKGIDYFENSRRATYVQQQYAIDNPLQFVGYDACCWGITASDGPGPAALKIDGLQRRFMDYEGRGIPYGPDDGTVAPWAVVASLPFAPDIVLPAIDHYVNNLKLTRNNRYGFKATYNPTFFKGKGKRPVADDDSPRGWVSPWHFGINQGPIVLMIENYRTGLLWDLMRRCPYIVQGLRRAGFSGGWL
ncbi:MAG: glucoamylase family protein [Burkholderiaceae bacterium]